MSLTPERLAEIERLAKAATPGSWHDWPLAVCLQPYTKDPQVVVNAVCQAPGGARPDGSQGAARRWIADRAYIAAADPATVLSLVERIRELEGIVQAVRDWLDREHKALSKNPQRDGHRMHSLIVLEEDMDDAESERDARAGGG